ncbi:uncharacterized membrane protein HdeD (DUF308 family) [Methanocalculus alkaliphilus]|uniref:HdeD family acid-resistance protein n=1 Tax=Methanocalculus alkaliphilus TaxID=768730 RepID=UPI00209E56AB|nr:DUF308 domain-containing protein [Methanocalculus alkaliphilus]MCP1714393.1 uncharacterized membrane protein HdeD (DUF308 family) [Methanocalculus alkaliphilus]
MQRIEDLLGPLHEGVWEVVIPKDSVQRLPDTRWTRSRINVPTPGTIASYRSGQYHLHETATEYRVHLDRYDPKKHPFLHLIDDAPLVLMIVDTVAALVTDSRNALGNTGSILEEQKKAWKLMILTGLFLILLGGWMASEPSSTFDSITRYIVPLILIGISIPFLRSGIDIHPFRIQSVGRLILGTGIAFIGFSAFFEEPEWTAGVLLLVVTVWTFASAWVSFGHTFRVRRGGLQEVAPRFLVGALSLLVAIAALFAPDTIIIALVFILAGIAILFGCYLILEGVAFRRRMKKPRLKI